jgi:hypothetical protein
MRRRVYWYGDFNPLFYCKQLPMSAFCDEPEEVGPLQSFFHGRIDRACSAEPLRSRSLEETTPLAASGDHRAGSRAGSVLPCHREVRRDGRWWFPPFQLPKASPCIKGRVLNDRRSCGLRSRWHGSHRLRTIFLYYAGCRIRCSLALMRIPVVRFGARSLV